MFVIVIVFLSSSGWEINYFFPSWEINFFISQPELEKKLVKLVAKESHMLKEYILHKSQNKCSLSLKKSALGQEFMECRM